MISAIHPTLTESTISNKTYSNTWRKSNIIVDDDNIIVSCHLQETGKLTYFCLKNTEIKDVVLSINYGHKPRCNIDFDFSDSESKSFDIPNHIPKEQHVKYIKEQFNLDSSTK